MIGFSGGLGASLDETPARSVSRPQWFLTVGSSSATISEASTIKGILIIEVSGKMRGYAMSHRTLYARFVAY